MPAAVGVKSILKVAFAEVLTEKTDKRKKSIYNDWLKEVNNLIKKCNKLANYPIFAVVK